jgi:hypothetical protein
MRLAIYIPDETYGKDGESEAATEKFKVQLENEYNQDLTYVDIGAGASWPVFLAYFTLDPWPFLAAAIALFFAGDSVNSNLDAWPKVANRIAKYFKHNPVLEREAAAFLAVEAVMKELGGLPRSVELKGYKTTNQWKPLGRQDFDDVQFDGIEIEAQPHDPRQLDGLIYWFHIESEGRSFRVSVDRSIVNIKEQE